jgi:mRNA interferase MazF
VQRGEVFRLRAPRAVRGHEQSGSRYGVVLQSDALLTLSTVIIAPTSTRALPASFRPEVEIDGSRTRVLVEQIGAIDPTRLGESHGLLARDELHDVDRALAIVLGLATGG